MNKNSKIISHNEHNKSFAEVYVEAKKRIISKGNRPEAPLEIQLDLLDQLAEFEFGKFLLTNKGWNGEWTHYAVMHQFIGRKSRLDTNGKPFCKLEDFILNKAPIVLATQERFLHFKTCLQKRVKDNAAIASLPCGIMDDLFCLDFSNAENCRLVGIDLDINSLQQAAEIAEEKDIKPDIELINTDAWNFTLKNEFDTISSNGLNIYEPNRNKVIELYKVLYNSLKKGGQLITSIITPPPQNNIQSDWLMDNINIQDLILQKILFVDVIGVDWTAARNVEENKNMLLAAGFNNINILFDKAHMFPTFTAEK